MRSALCVLSACFSWIQKGKTGEKAREEAGVKPGEKAAEKAGAKTAADVGRIRSTVGATRLVYLGLAN